MNPKELISLIEQLNKRIFTIEQKISQMQTAITTLASQVSQIENSMAELQ